MPAPLRIFLKVACVIAVAAIVLTGIQAMRIMSSAKKVSYSLRPFQKDHPQADYKVLFAGDSTCVGTGAEDNTLSTAGWFSRDFPRAAIENYCRNGMRLDGLIDILSGLQGRHYDLAVFQIGANDILNFTPLTLIDEQEQEVIRLAKKISDRIIILHSGDVGDAPLFIWPFRWILTWRSQHVRDIYMKNQDRRVAYVDIYQLEKTVPDRRSTYSPDGLHLNGNGYRIWYRFIKTQL